MLMKFTIRYEGESEQVAEIGPADIVAFERKYDVPLAQFEQGARMEWMLFLAWAGLRRRKLTADEFDAWTERVEAIEPVEQPGKAEASPEAEGASIG